MDKLKGAVGLGGNKEEGQEPVNGAKGEGTTAEPYDSGNKQEATQAADSNQDSSEFGQEHSYLSSAIDADQERAADESKFEPPPPSSTKEEQPPAKEEKKGGFFKSLGLGGSKKKEEEKDAQATAEKAAEDKAEAEKHLPPNHLGSAVPKGVSTDLADPGTVAPGQTDGLAAQQQSTAPVAVEPPKKDTTPRSPSTSAGKMADRGDSVGSGSGLSPDRSMSAGSGGGSALPGSRGEHRGSMIPPDAVKYKRVENPDRIPTAGGKKIGEEQYQTRRASMAPPASPPRDMAKLDREGSPDPVTAGNTEVNTMPTPAPPTSTSAPGGGAATTPHVEGKNTAPQEMKEFSMGDASKDAEQKPLGVGTTEAVAPDEGSPSGNAAAPGVAAGQPSSSPSAGKENPSGGGGHARRGSIFDKLKSKLKGDKSK